MKKISLFVLCCVTLLFSQAPSWANVKDPILRNVRKDFENVTLKAILKKVPSSFSIRCPVVYATDASIKGRIQTVRRGAVDAVFFPEAIRIVDEGVVTLDVKVEGGIEIEQTQKNRTKVETFRAFMFIGNDATDKDMRYLVRVAFHKDLFGGNASVTFFDAREQWDWMGFRIVM